MVVYRLLRFHWVEFREVVISRDQGLGRVVVPMKKKRDITRNGPDPCKAVLNSEGIPGYYACDQIPAVNHDSGGYTRPCLMLISSAPVHTLHPLAPWCFTTSHTDLTAYNYDTQSYMRKQIYKNYSLFVFFFVSSWIIVWSIKIQTGKYCQNH